MWLVNRLFINYSQHNSLLFLKTVNFTVSNWVYSFLKEVIICFHFLQILNSYGVGTGVEGA